MSHSVARLGNQSEEVQQEHSDSQLSVIRFLWASFFLGIDLDLLENVIKQKKPFMSIKFVKTIIYVLLFHFPCGIYFIF
jgi:hypothetical protein